MHKVLDLFSGIGGFSKGLEDTGGFETVAFCEFDEHARKVLSKHWKGVKQYTDIRELTYEQLQADGIKPTVLTGGFPCQDISVAGKQAGIIGERSSLWSEYFRLIKDVQPTWAIIENVSALRSKGLALVLQNLSEIGYNAEWHCIPCSAIGGLHRRDRIWIIAYPSNNKRDVAHSKSEFSQWDQHERTEEGQSETKTRNRGGSQGDVENSNNYGFEGGRSETRNQTSSRKNPKENRRDYSDNTSRSSNDGGDSKESSVNGTLQGSSNGYKTKSTTSTGLYKVSEESNNGKRVGTENRNQENDSRTLVQERQGRIQSPNDRGLGEDQTSLTRSEVQSRDDNIRGNRMATTKTNVGNTKHDGSSSSKESRVYEETIRRSEEGQNETFQSERTSTRGIISDQSVSDSDSKGLQGSKLSTDYDGQETGGEASTTRSASKPNSFRGEPDTIVKREGLELFSEYAKTKWAVEPNVGRVAYGIPNRVHRLKQLGNSVVPQIPEFLGYCILNYEKIKGETK